MPLVSLNTLLLGNTVVQFGVGFALLFVPKALSNPLNALTPFGEWEGGAALKALRPILGIATISQGVLSLLEANPPESEKGRKISRSILAYFTLYHSLVVIPVATQLGFTITQIPTFVVHALLAVGFGSFLIDSKDV